MKANPNSPYYPYEKVMTGYNGFRGVERIPYQILMYLLDLPDKNGYEPKDDNERPRVRLMKYLWYDDENPLGKVLPNAEEKKSMIYDGEQPALNTNELKANHPKGYRLFSQKVWGQSQQRAKSLIKCYIGRVVSLDGYRHQIGISFEIIVGVDLETNTRTSAYARAYDMEQCLLEALHGVNITGVGVIEFSRTSHVDNGSRALYDEGNHVGREVNMSVLWEESNPELNEIC